MTNPQNRRIMKKAYLLFAILLSTSMLWSQDAAPAEGLNLPWMPDMNTLLLIIAALLLLPLWASANAFLRAAKRYYQFKWNSGKTSVLIPFFLLLSASSAFAQPTTGSVTTGIDSDVMLLMLLGVIAIEFLFILFFSYKTNEFLAKLDGEVEKERKSFDPLSWMASKWKRANYTTTIQEEHTIDTGHNYDGIRELDNPIPTWFTTAFLITILFAGVYIYRYHIAKSAPLQLEELKMANIRAEEEHREYLATQASNIDESNVEPMTGADLEAGKSIFNTLCAVCHKQDGGGLVGPNMTDEYWIHGGSLQDIFKTVKYGVPDKGMISWKSQLSPIQMAQVSNYILTLQGTNPPDAKAPQGELYVPEVMNQDTITSTSTDTLQVQ